METVLITGGTSGIGYEIAKIFAKKRFKIILVARNLKKLEQIKEEFTKDYKGCEIFFIKADLSKEENINMVYDKVKGLNLKVNYLINNAGFGLMGKFTELNIDEQLEMIKLNIIALTKLTYLFLEDMKKEKKGKILNIGSIAGFTPGPNMAVYYASKSYVISFSQALKEELRFSGITVTALCPGATKSKFSEVAKAKKSLLFLMPMSTKRVARVGYIGMMSGVSLIVPGICNNVFALWLKLTPAILNSQLVKITSIKLGK